MNKTCGIYVIINKINKKTYVGLSVNCEKRWSDHKSKALNSKRKDDIEKPLYRAMRKYGLDNFTFSILEQCEKDELKEKECLWIIKLNSYTKGYNATFGGDNYSKEHVLKGEQHGMSKLKESDVIRCREWYKEGKSSKEIWEMYYKSHVKYTGFQRMWHGKTWKHIMPEVFQNNPRPRTRATKEQIEDIRKRFASGEKIYHITKSYRGVLAHATIWEIANNNRHKN